MNTWAIGEVAARSGIPASTIRYYEQIELLPPAGRVNGEPEAASGRRQYNPAILQKLNIIRLAQQAGFTIAEIQTLLHNFPADAPPPIRWQLMAQQKLAELEERLQTIQAIKTLLEDTLNCQCDTLDECGDGLFDAS